MFYLADPFRKKDSRNLNHKAGIGKSHQLKSDHTMAINNLKFANGFIDNEKSYEDFLEYLDNENSEDDDEDCRTDKLLRLQIILKVHYGFR